MSEDADERDESVRQHSSGEGREAESAESKQPQLEVGVAFRHNPKIYSFASVGYRLNIGDRVLVRTEKGVDIGEVREINGRISDERVQELMPVVRKATAEDLEHVEEQERREQQAMKICAEKIEKHGLPMKLIDCSLSFDNTRLVFFFSADGRVDFRELVRDLARTFRMRIELRQIGVRDEAKLLGGLGPCGRRLCCKTFMRDFEPVGIRVAKDQGLALNPNKISGLCDRLMCCLLFEHETYCELRDRLPEKGEIIDTPHGRAKVRDVSLLKEQIHAELKDGTEITVSASEIGCDGRERTREGHDEQTPGKDAATPEGDDVGGGPGGDRGSSQSTAESDDHRRSGGDNGNESGGSPRGSRRRRSSRRGGRSSKRKRRGGGGNSGGKN